jgi:hypothetical protein
MISSLNLLAVAHQQEFQMWPFEIAPFDTLRLQKLQIVFTAEILILLQNFANFETKT